LAGACLDVLLEKDTAVRDSGAKGCRRRLVAEIGFDRAYRR
jgi:hypothetical protein